MYEKRSYKRIRSAACIFPAKSTKLSFSVVSRTCIVLDLVSTVFVLSVTWSFCFCFEMRQFIKVVLPTAIFPTTRTVHSLISSLDVERAGLGASIRLNLQQKTMRKQFPIALLICFFIINYIRTE